MMTSAAVANKLVCVCLRVQSYVEQVMLGYLRLLVNSRDELSLARIINVPHRGLDHTAFTDVKHEAKRRGLSMYQVVVVFVVVVVMVVVVVVVVVAAVVN